MATSAQQTLHLLQQFESRNITFMDPAPPPWPIVWDRAEGISVWDVDGKHYFDLTAAFGVAASGHTNPRVVEAGREQIARLGHAMGDVHPHPRKAELVRELSRITFERWLPEGEGRHGKTILGNSGFEAVEAALKTAVQATGKPGVIAFEGGYHGLGYGALNVTHRADFREPFRSQLRELGHFMPYPVAEPISVTRPEPLWPSAPSASPDLGDLERQIRTAAGQSPIGAILVEPVQGRGGIRVPPPGFLPLLRRLADQLGMLLIVDEIYTGLGRTGHWFATEAEQTVPDLICLGKALTGGFPLSACVGRADWMDLAWPPSTGEAIHTSTFLGHPVGCAMALAQIQEIECRDLPTHAHRVGADFLGELHDLARRQSTLHLRPKGAGLMLGLECVHQDGTPGGQWVFDTIRDLLREGWILLPEGEHGHVIAFTPPLTIELSQLKALLPPLETALDRRSSPS